MKLKKSDVSLLLIVLGIGIALATYYLVYLKLSDKTESLEASNAVLRDEVARLEELNNNRQEYETKTVEWEENMKDIESRFDAAYRPEDEILYVNGLEKTFDATAATISMPGSAIVDVAYTPAQTIAMGSEEPVTNENGEVINAEITAPTEPPVRLYATPVTISYVASYEAVKSLLEDMNQDEMRKSIDNITMAFDGQTGGITGSMTFTMYSMTGTDAVYEVPAIPGISFGTKDIFNSAAKSSAIKAAQAAAGN